MFVRAGKGCSAFIAGCTLLFASTVINADQQPGYRLAGILELWGEPSIAIVESGGTRQELVRVGDALGDGEVVSIDAHSIRVATAAGVITLTLEYGFANLAAAAEEQPKIASLTVDEQKLERLNKLQGDTEAQLTRKFLNEFELPDDAKLRGVWIGEHRFTTMKAALPQLRSALQSGEMAHLFFSESSQIDEVYLMPEQTPEDTN